MGAVQGKSEYKGKIKGPTSNNNTHQVWQGFRLLTMAEGIVVLVEE